ncbi:MAG: hypothetical protein CVU80_01145 [Elusimicrobia bacterium HGW-Elusimicrobia-4]|nr:MAG: hypothetical protein CVU80_01145 [Elusimicrobia bacterium HGW-Elusimicrobia-4]
MKKRILLFLGCVIIFFSNVIFTDKIFFFRDMLNLFHPYRLFAAENIQNGIIPIWNPYTFFGQPFLANPETSLFYPFTTLFYIFEFSIAYKLFIVLHFFLASMLFYIAARFLKAKNSYSIIASVAWAFGGYLVARIEFLSILGAAIWLPLSIIFLIRNKKILLGLVFAIQIFAGHPQVFFYTIVFSLFFLNKKRVLTLTSSLIITFFLAAVQLLPFAEFVKNSNRAEGLTYEEASSVSITASEIIRNLLPKKNIDITGNYWLKSFYIGIIPLIFVFVYFITSDKKLLLPLIIIVILALGRNTPVYLFLYNFVLPFSKIRYPAAIMFLFAFVLCMLVSRLNIGKLNKFIPLFFILTITDLYYNSLKLNPKISSKLLNIKTENIAKLQDISDGKKYLVLPDAYSPKQNYFDFINSLPTNINIPHHIYNASGYDPLTTGKIENFIEKLTKNPKASELAKYDIKYLITDGNVDSNWKKITKNLFENKISFPKNVIVSPQNFRPQYIIFLTGLWLTIFSTVILILTL